MKSYFIIILIVVYIILVLNIQNLAILEKDLHVSLISPCAL
jgi:hypothetical protein